MSTEIVSTSPFQWSDQKLVLSTLKKSVCPWKTSVSLYFWFERHPSSDTTLLGSIAQPEIKHTTHTHKHRETQRVLRGSAIAYVHGRDNNHYKCNGITMKEEEEIHTHSTLTLTHTEYSLLISRFFASTRLTGVRRSTSLSLCFYSTQAWLEGGSLCWIRIGMRG